MRGNGKAIAECDFLGSSSTSDFSNNEGEQSQAPKIVDSHSRTSTVVVDLEEGPPMAIPMGVIIA